MQARLMSVGGRKLMRNLVMSLFVVGVIAPAYGTPMPEQTRKNFVNSGVQTCLFMKRQDPMSKHMTESELNEYCYCYMNRVADLITLETITRAEQTMDFSPLVPAFETARSYCTQMLKKT
jgi:hypothetical protein